MNHQQQKENFCYGFVRTVLEKGLDAPSPRGGTWESRGRAIYGPELFGKWLVYWMLKEIEAVMEPGDILSIHELVNLMSLAGEFDWLEPVYKRERVAALMEQHPERFERQPPRYCSATEQVVRTVFKRVGRVRIRESLIAPGEIIDWDSDNGEGSIT